MTDISMCADKDCPSRGRCHRWCAWPDGMMQGYRDFRRRSGAHQCAHFWIRYADDRTPEQADADVVARS